MENEHGYAKQFLHNTNFEIYVGENRILEYDGFPNYDVLQEFITRIEIGQQIGDILSEVKIITSYSDLVGLGYIIIARRAENYEKTFRGQSKIYELAKRDSGRIDIGQFPSGHFVQQDVMNKAVRLVGKNAGLPGRVGRGLWIFSASKIVRNREYIKERNFFEYFKKAEEIINRISSTWAPVEEEPQFMDIPEIVFMVSNSNELVCIDPNVGDPPVFGLIGSRGGGKTLCMHNIVDQIHHKTAGDDPLEDGHRIVLFNDRQQQFLSWSKPTTSQGFINELQMINHEPQPLPCVFLFPNDSNLGSIDIEYGNDKTLNENEGVSFRITLPYEGIVDNYKYFFEGRKNWALGGSEKYFNPLRPYLKRCRTLPQIRTVLNTYLGGETTEEGQKKEKGLKGSITKIYSAMEDLYQSRIMDVNTDYPSKWAVFLRGKKLGEFFPISALLTARLIPVIENNHLYTRDYYPQYMRFLIDDVYENLLAKRLPYKTRTWAMFDEIGQIYKRNKKRTVAAETLIDSFTEGRKPNLGSGYTLQSWDKVDEEIRLNTEYVIAFNVNQPKDLSELGSSFDLKKYIKEDIKKLKQFECVAMTTKRFKVYTMDGDAYFTEGPIKGKIIKPTSEHTKPG